MTSSLTPFIEANALLAINDDRDYAEARHILCDESLSGLYALEQTARALADFCRDLANERRDAVEDGAG